MLIYLHYICACLFILATPSLLLANQQELDQQLQKLKLPSSGKWSVIEPEELVGLMQQGITEKNTTFLIKLLQQRDRLIGQQSLRALTILPEQYQYQFFALMLDEDSFWRNLNLETDSTAEMEAMQQETVVAGLNYMIQQDVSLQNLYDPGKRSIIRETVRDVLKNGLPNRKPNWQPKEWVPNASPKKTIYSWGPVPSPTIDQTLDAPVLQSIPVTLETSAAPAVETKSMSLRWLIGAIFIMVVAGGFFLSRR